MHKVVNHPNLSRVLMVFLLWLGEMDVGGAGAGGTSKSDGGDAIKYCNRHAETRLNDCLWF